MRSNHFLRLKFCTVSSVNVFYISCSGIHVTVLDLSPVSCSFFIGLTLLSFEVSSVGVSVAVRLVWTATYSLLSSLCVPPRLHLFYTYSSLFYGRFTSFNSVTFLLCVGKLGSPVVVIG